MSITADRVELSDDDVELLSQASRLNERSAGTARRRTQIFAGRREKADGQRCCAPSRFPPATLRLLSENPRPHGASADVRPSTQSRQS